MTYKPLLLGAACAAGMALMPIAAMAASDMAGTVSGGYANTSYTGVSGSADSYGISGEGKLQTGLWDMQIQGDAGYHHTSAGGVDINDWNLGGHLFWALSEGRIGATVGYRSADASGVSVDITNYGAFAEWWPTGSITLAGRGGGFNADLTITGLGTGSGDGYYLGGSATGYVIPDFSVSGAVDYARIHNLFDVTSYTARAEYLVSEQVPLSISAGYTYSHVSFLSGHANTWFVALTWYCDEAGGNQTLVSRQRTGTLGSSASFNPLANVF